MTATRLKPDAPRKRPPPAPIVAHPPPEKPDQDGTLRWPNGAGVFRQGGTGNPLMQLGWIINTPDAGFLTYGRTGPGEDDIRFMGASADHPAAMALLPAEAWGEKIQLPAKRERRAKPEA